MTGRKEGTEGREKERGGQLCNEVRKEIVREEKNEGRKKRKEGMDKEK